MLIVSTSTAMVPGSDERTGLFLTELATPFQTLSQRGAQVDVATIAGGMPPFEPNSVDAPEERAMLAEPKLNTALSGARALQDIDTSQYDAVILAGGQGALFDYSTTPAVRQALAGVYERGGIVAAICHGVNGLADVTVDGRPLVEGRRVTGYSDAEDTLSQNAEMRPRMTESKLRAAGGDYQAAPPSTSNVVTDGRIITGQNPASAQAFGTAIANALGLEHPVRNEKTPA